MSETPILRPSARLKAAQGGGGPRNDLAALVAEETGDGKADFVDLDISPAFRPLAALDGGDDPAPAEADVYARTDEDYARALAPKGGAVAPSPVPPLDLVEDVLPPETGADGTAGLTGFGDAPGGGGARRRYWPVAAAVVAALGLATYLGTQGWPDATAVTTVSAGVALPASVPPVAVAKPDPRPFAFTDPIRSDGSAADGRSLAELLDGSSPFTPLAALPETLWQGETCAGCHAWTPEALCEQGEFYGAKGLPATEHPYGGAFKKGMMHWAAGGCVP